jgi:predicted small secreted protein
MKRFFRSLALLATVTALFAGAVGCHTVKGVGRDVQSVGRGVEDVSGK